MGQLWSYQTNWDTDVDRFPGPISSEHWLAEAKCRGQAGAAAQGQALWPGQSAESSYRHAIVLVQRDDNKQVSDKTKLAQSLIYLFRLFPDINQP